MHAVINHCECISLQGAGTNEKMLIEILCARTNAEIALIKEEYKTCMYYSVLQATAFYEAFLDLNVHTQLAAISIILSADYLKMY